MSTSKRSKRSSEKYFTLLDRELSFQATEAFKTLRTNLIFSLATKGKKAFAVTSSIQHEGKSTMTANLAITFAQMQAKVLLIDADLRKPVQQKLFKLQNKEGLSTLLTGMSSFKSVVNEDIIPGLDVVTCGPIPPNPSEMLASENMKILLEELTKYYDYIKKKGVLSEEEMNDITCDICSGLCSLHEKGIVHRDLTPRNIMITAESKAVIIDFGISRFRKADKTADTQILGTQGFAAPEQFGFSQTDSRADIYSIGVLMNYMLTQSLPNEKPAGGKPGKIIAKCISPDVNDRYQSVEELRSVIKKKINLFPIPGFRKKKWWHIAVAVFYYSAAVFFAVIAFLSGIEKSPVTAVLNSIGFIYIFLVPVVAVFYFNKWLNKWFFTRNNRVWERVMIIVLTIFVLTIIGCLLFFLEKKKKI